jgi:hypothetical protein
MVAGANLTDTAGAAPSQALVVEVRDSSGAIPPLGTVVRFSSVGAGPYTYVYEALVESLTSTYFGTFATGNTDQAGRAGVLVKLGTKAGPARIVVAVPTLNLVDTARFTVNPGAAYRAFLTPVDTVLYVGKSFTLRGAVVDQWNNPRPDPVTWGSSGPGLTVSSVGAVNTSAAGRYTITARSAIGVSASSVSVVPQGRLATWSGASGGAGSIVTVDLDGSHQSTVATVNDGGIGAHPAWVPGSGTIVYTTVVNGLQTLYKIGPDGVETPFFATTPPNVTHEAEPTPSADGKWLFFSAYDPRCQVPTYCPYRAKIDGSAPELLSTMPSSYPAPSPDGSRLAFGAGYDGGTIKVLDVATRMESSWGVHGGAPAWSPTGNQIAYLGTGSLVWIMNADGTGAHELSPAVYAQAPISWSPDGKWIVVRGQSGVQLVDPVTAVAVPLVYATNFAPSLK